MSGTVVHRSKGTLGTLTKVTANMYPLQMDPKRMIYVYEVVIKPELSEGASRRNYELIDILQTRAHPQAFTPRAAYDGSHIMLSSVLYSWGTEGVFNLLTSRRNPPPPPGEKGHFVVTVSYKDAFPASALASYLHGHAGGIMIPPEQVVTYTNIFLRQAAMHLHAFRGRYFYVQQGHKELGDWLILCRGFFQSVRATVTGPMVNINVSSALIWTKRPLMETVLSILNLSDHRALARLDDRQIWQLNHLLKRVRILPRHRPGGAPKAICGFDKRGADSIMLEGTETTIEAYFRERYNLTLRYPKYVCVTLAKDKQNILPIELCEIDGKQFFEMKKLANPNWEKQIRTFAMMKPAERLRITNTGSEALQHPTSDYMARAGIRVNQAPLAVNARMIPAIPVIYGAGIMATPRFGAWKPQKFYKPTSLKYWAVVVLDHQAPPGAVMKFVTQLIAGMEYCGMTVLDKTPTLFPKDGRESVTQTLARLRADLTNRFPGPPDLLLVITPGDPDWYNEVKRFGDIIHGIATQHVLSSKALAPNVRADYCENVALKVLLQSCVINVKLGGINHVPIPASIAWIRNSPDPIMVIGADTSHPSPRDAKERSKPTIAAIAYSVDQNVTKYNGILSIQRGLDEIIVNLGVMMKGALSDFFSRYNKPPGRILFYRDGVGEGMFEEVRNTEIQAIRKAFMDLKYPQAKITFIIVGKGHHVRFYPGKGDEDASGNVNPGMIVDTTITSPAYDDFYLLAHQGILGTSRPMHATPIYDENGLTADQLHATTFALTHNYPRATRSVSIPSPVYHADILCNPIRARVHFDPSVDYGASDTASSQAAVPTSQQYLQAFQSTHVRLRNTMFWM